MKPMTREIEDFIPDDEPEALSGYEQILYDTVLIPSGTEEIERQNYRMTSYVNDVNQEYTQVLMEYDVNGEVASVYDYGVQRNSYTNQRRDASQTQYYVYDGRGSVSALTSIYGNAVVSYQYDAYGSAKVSGDTYSPYQYNAEAVDWNTGLQYLRARYYNSNIGGFLTQDTYLGMLEDPLTFNLYTYTGNNPVNLMDPSGHWWAGSTVNKNGITIKSDNPFSKRDTYPKKPTSNTTKDDSKYGAAGIGRYIDMPGRLHIEKPNPGSTNGKAGIANYIDMPSANYDTYVDPTTQRLEDKYGTVTKQTTSYAYAGGKYITAMTAMEQIFCSAWEKAKTSIKNTVDGLPDPLIKIANFFKGVGDATLSNYLPIETKEGDVKYPIMYYSGKITGDVLNVLDMLFAVSQGGKAGGKGGSKTLAGADGNTQIVISADIDSAFAGALVGKVVGNDITEDIKKLEESIEKAKKGDSGGKNKGGSDASLDTGKWNKGSFESPEKSLRKHFNKHGAEVGANDPQQYLRKAEEFARNLKGARKAYDIPGETPNITRYYKNGKYIDLAPDGTIISFGKQ